MKVSYYAVFDYSRYDWREKKAGISIYFPDVETAYTCARNEVEGIKFAREVLVLAFSDEEDLIYPEKTPLEKIPLGKNERAYLIEYDTDDVDPRRFPYRDDIRIIKKIKKDKKKEGKSRKQKKIEKRRMKEEKSKIKNKYST